MLKMSGPGAPFAPLADVHSNMVCGSTSALSDLIAAGDRFSLKPAPRIKVQYLQAACQDDADKEEDSDNEEAEYDTMLIEYAGDVIPALAKVCSSYDFAPYLAGMLPHLVVRTVSSS